MAATENGATEQHRSEFVCGADSLSLEKCRVERFVWRLASCGRNLRCRFVVEQSSALRFAKRSPIPTPQHFEPSPKLSVRPHFTMSDIVPGIRTLDDLQGFVKTKLCEKENLLLEQSKFRHTPLIKQGKLCGFQFSVQGPRQVRLGAVWASDHNDIYFYDTRGNRYHKVHLPERIALPEPMAEMA